MNLTVKKLQNIQDKVEWCLDRYPETRNDDIALFVRLCENFYPPLEKPIFTWRDMVYALHQVTSIDHIARCRRKVIENHKYTKYLPTERRIALARKINEKVWNEYATANKYNVEDISI